MEDDPAYTGERRGLGWAMVHLVGMLIAIPLAQIRFQVRALEGMASFGRTPEEDRILESGETAIKTSRRRLIDPGNRSPTWGAGSVKTWT